jgi:hypothetical protein
MSCLASSRLFIATKSIPWITPDTGLKILILDSLSKLSNFDKHLLFSSAIDGIGGAAAEPASSGEDKAGIAS